MQLSLFDSEELDMILILIRFDSVPISLGVLYSLIISKKFGIGMVFLPKLLENFNYKETASNTSN